MKEKLEVKYIRSFYGYNHLHHLMNPLSNIHVPADSFKEFKSIIQTRLPNYDLEFIKDEHGFLLM